MRKKADHRRGTPGGGAGRPPAGFRPEGAKPFESLAPLPEVLAASTGGSATGKKTLEQYERMLQTLGPEFYILREAPLGDIAQVAGPCVAEGIRRLRAGQVARRAGFDGEYGEITLLTPAEIEQFSGQISLFGLDSPTPRHPRSAGRPSPGRRSAGGTSDGTRGAQRGAAGSGGGAEPVVAVVAGPGTGKTKTLVNRIAYLVEQQGVKPDEITAVTFTNQAADEMLPAAPGAARRQAGRGQDDHWNLPRHLPDALGQGAPDSPRARR